MMLAVIVFVFVKFRHQRDGYGLKDNLKYLAAFSSVIAAPLTLIYVWEAFDDLPYYVESLHHITFFTTVNVNMFIILGLPIYHSLNESAQGGMSSIAEDPVDELDEVVELATHHSSGDEQEAGGDEHASPHDGTGEAGPTEAAVAASAGGAGAAPPARKADTDAAPAVFSLKTISVPLEGVLLNPKYHNQMRSFTRHLIGEFNVEGVLFYFRVLNFQKFVKDGKKSTPNIMTESNPEVQEPSGSNLSQFSDSQSEKSAKSSNENEVALAVKTTDFDVEVAWKALGVYFEFVAPFSHTQVRAPPFNYTCQATYEPLDSY